MSAHLNVLVYAGLLYTEMSHFTVSTNSTEQIIVALIFFEMVFILTIIVFRTTTVTRVNESETALLLHLLELSLCQNFL